MTVKFSKQPAVSDVVFTITLKVAAPAGGVDREDLRAWLDKAIDRMAEDEPPTAVDLGSWDVADPPQEAS